LIEEKYQKIKNLILLLNKLLYNLKNSSNNIGTYNNSILLNNILFDKNTIDTKNGINLKILDEVTNNILSIN
jgi:hypothetical protein